ncbi:hypothetical protein SAMN05421823_10470 [Catalinimonas alkaloidigena]|uniref:Uncharacterized protein n=1 Tax=Catalinimonas alkaloidigena TaxID=1075417 RepID=A0A1G9GD85_9BACT|nr:hypothetical protein [Catalinimonas alkaloidigena]SDK98572.1 hypothetical protein SAMN05421823_10470 [Catalinimonas alkaloidigena]
MNFKTLSWIVRAIAWITLASGLTQVVAPSLVLQLIGAVTTPTSAHFFSLVGMFMALFGGLVLHALRQPETARVPLFWASCQKAGAVLGVALGVYKGIFGALALGVAGFDALSALVMFYFWSLLAHERNAIA